MAGQRNVYDSAMSSAADAAWEQQWDQAIQAYQVALGEFPEDTEALSGIGLALVESNRLDDALNVYRRMAQLFPDDPFARERMADVLQRMGQGEEAGQQFLGVAEVYLSQHNVERAIWNWEQAAALLPNEVKLRSRLAVAYERTGQIDKAVREYLALAGAFQRQNDPQKSMQAVQRALRIDPANDSVRSSLAAIRQGSAINLPDTPADPVTERHSGFEPFDISTTTDKQMSSPIGEATELAMSVLAELMFEGNLPPDSLAGIAKAIDAQRAGDVSTAADGYTDALNGGLDHPAAWFNTGLVFFQYGDAESAIGVLERSLHDPTYALASNLVVGQGYLSLEQYPEAANYLVNALRHADLSLSPPESQVEINGAFDSVLHEISGQSEELLRTLSQSLLEILDNDNWRKRLADMRSNLRSSDASQLVSMLLEPGAEKVAGSLQLIDTYISNNQFVLAMDEAHYAVELSPSNLPAHMKMADIMARENKLDAAAEKYNIVAKSLLVRGDSEQAADVFAEVLKLSPTDINARQRLIEMLVEQGRVAPAIEHYEAMAEIHMTLADTEQASKTYKTALELARQSNVETKTMVSLLYKVAEFDSQRLEWRDALSIYEEIKELAPGSEKAHLGVIDLSFRLGDNKKAIDGLDAYLAHLIKNGNIERVVSLMEEQVRSHADDIQLRQRLAKVYQEQGRQQDAIAQLDALGELLLEAGRQSEAVAVLQQIVDMNPPDVDGYRQLLQQLEG